MKKLFFFFNLLLSTSILTFSQTGSIKGKIIDEKTGEELIGASVVIKGSTTGTISDFDGNYALANLKAGEYNITISYVSYESQEFPNVVVKPGEVTVLNAQLGEATTALEEVQVVARSNQRTEASLQVLQQKSATVLDGISSQQISRLGDADAAGALKRVTGVSVQEGKYVYVRGLSDHFMKVTLNGAEVPGLDPNFNTVQMDLFPSNVIESMTVLKTYTPDKPSFTGGLVNIKTKDFPLSFTFHASVKDGFNNNVHFNDKFLTYQGSSTDRLAYDNGFRSIPDGLKGIEISTVVNSKNVDLVSDYTNRFNKVWTPQNSQAPLNQSYSLSFGDQKSFAGNKSIGYIAALSYKTKSTSYQNGRLDDYDAQTATTVAPNEILSEDKGEYTVTWSALAGLNLKLSTNNKIGFTYLRAQSGERTARSMHGHNSTSDNYDEDKYSLEYLWRVLSVYQLSGTHVLPRLNHARIDWMSSNANSIQNTPDLRFFYDEIIYNGNDTIYNVRVNKKPERRYRNMNEYNWDNTIDLTFPINMFDGKFKFGASYLKKRRNSEESRFTVNQKSTISFNGDPEDFFTQENIITPDNLSQGYFYAIDFLDNARISYLGQDITSAGYGMLDFTFLDKLRVIGGVRVERTSMFIENKVDPTDPDLRPSQKKLYETGSTNDFDLLPSINLKYELINNMNLRFAFSKSITRPSFRERAPYAFYEYTEGTTIQGNPNLKLGRDYNYDIRWEYFFNTGEMISLSGFYKKILGPIERYKSQTTENQSTYRNGYDATLYGLELEIRKNLDFVQFLKNFDLGVNVTFIKSETPVDSARLAYARNIAPDFPGTRPLYGQSPYVVNAFLHYDNEKLGLHSNLSFHVEGPKIVIISKRLTPDVYQQPFPALNFNIGKTIFKNLELEFSAENLLDPTFKENITLSDGETYPFRQFSLGRTYSISLKYSIK